MGAGSKPLRPWQVCAGDVIGSGKRVEYVFERYGELYINASDEELVRQGKRTYGEELTRLYDLDLSGWRVIGHYGCGRGYEGRSWYDMGKPVMFGETLYGGDGRDWLIVGIAGAWSYDVYGLHVAHDGKKEKKPLRAEWLVHELTDAGEEV